MDTRTGQVIPDISLVGEKERAHLVRVPTRFDAAARAALANGHSLFDRKEVGRSLAKWARKQKQAAKKARQQAKASRKRNR